MNLPVHCPSDVHRTWCCPRCDHALTDEPCRCVPQSAKEPPKLPRPRRPRD
jgi:hypothetical protein